MKILINFDILKLLVDYKESTVLDYVFKISMKICMYIHVVLGLIYKCHIQLLWIIFFFCGWMIHGIISDDSVLVNLSVVWCFCRFLFRILFLPHRFVWLAVVLRSGSILGKAVVDKASVRTLLLWEGGSHDWSCLQGDVADS